MRVYLAFGRTNLEKVIHLGAITSGLFRWGHLNDNDHNNYEMTFYYLQKYKILWVFPQEKKVPGGTEW